MRRTLALLLLLLPTVAAGCQCGKGFTAADKAAIRARGEAWTAAANARDHAAVAAIYTEDAALLPPNFAAVRGREGVREFMAGLPPFSEMKLVPVEIAGSGAMAYVWGDYSMTIRVSEGAPPFKDRGKYIEVWTRGKDGTWSIHRDIFNSDLPAPGP